MLTETGKSFRVLKVRSLDEAAVTEAEEGRPPRRTTSPTEVDTPPGMDRFEASERFYPVWHTAGHF
jgi:hypothetical protein